MIDTGSEANIIKSHLLPTEIDFNNYKTVLLKGVGDKFQNTIGSIEIAIYIYMYILYYRIQELQTH